MRRLRAEHLLPLACAGAIALLAASQFMSIFELNGAPGQTFQLQTAFEQHHVATIVLAVFALFALTVAVAGGSKPAAMAVAVAGVAALLIFLAIDLPEAGREDTLEGEQFTTATADPATGFWVELAGALILAICGGVLATLTPDQLRSFRFSRSERARPTPAKPQPESSNPPSDSEPTPEDERSRKPSLARTQGGRRSERT